MIIKYINWRNINDHKLIVIIFSQHSIHITKAEFVHTVLYKLQQMNKNGVQKHRNYLIRQYVWVYMFTFSHGTYSTSEFDGTTRYVIATFCSDCVQFMSMAITSTSWNLFKIFVHAMIHWATFISMIFCHDISIVF